MMPQTLFTAEDKQGTLNAWLNKLKLSYLWLSIVGSYNFYIIECNIILPSNLPNFIENDSSSYPLFRGPHFHT